MATCCLGPLGRLIRLKSPRKLGQILVEEGAQYRRCVWLDLAAMDEARRSDNAEEIAARLPYFCSGCPHNSSTKVPEGSRAYAGIGCHFMVQWMDRETLGFTHMGGEGANWIGEAPFSTRDHVFQNLGDGDVQPLWRYGDTGGVGERDEHHLQNPL